MSEIKVNLTVILPGRVMMSEQECSKNPKENYNYYKQTLLNEEGKQEQINFSTRKSIPAMQSLNLCKDAYIYMIGKNNKPEWYKAPNPKQRWELLSNSQRLKAHLNRICQEFGGTSYTYKVFDD